MVRPQVKSEVTVPNGTPSGTLFVCVSGTFGKKIQSKVTKAPVSLEDCARGYWKDQHLSQAHADECDWLMAHCGGEIKGVWKIDRKKGWRPMAQVPKSTWPEDRRVDYPSSACDLIPVDDSTWNRFVGKCVRLGHCWNPLRAYFE